MPSSTDAEGEGLANRLIKNYSYLQPWAQENNVTCFRVYDADIPEFNFSFDLYEDCAYVSENKPTPKTDKQKTHQRLQTGLNVIRQLFSIPPSRLFIRTNQPAKGKKGSQKQNM